MKAGGSKRLKGKARAEAKKASNGGKPSTPPAGPKYTIAIKDFVPLAEYVAASKKPLVSVPLTFVKTLDRVVTARSRFGLRMKQYGEDPDEKSDLRHNYFTGILEKVREVLKPRVAPATQDAAHSDEEPALLGDLGGRFAKLNVYEPSEEFLNAPDIERPAPVKNDNASYETEPLKDFEDAIFAFALMLDDLDKIRAQVGWIWERVRDNSMDMAAAAVATNTACDLARNLSAELEPLFERHGGVIQVASKYNFMQCVMAGHSLVSALTTRAFGQKNTSTLQHSNKTNYRKA